MKHLLPRYLLLVLVCSCGLTGCQESRTLTVVTGVVAHQESALTRGSLRFYGTDKRPIGSAIQSDGSYTVELPPGDYRVSVSYPPPPPKEGEQFEENPSRSTKTIPAKFTQPNTSGLEVSVGASPEQVTYNITLN